MEQQVKEIEVGGEILQVRGVPPMYLSRWQIERNKKRPRPPKTVVTIVDEQEVVSNPQDPAYQQELAEFEDETGQLLAEFVLGYGVLTSPPKGWKPDPLTDWTVHKDPEMNRKILWVGSLAGTPEELDNLTKKLMGLTMSTEEAVEEEIDNFPGNGERVSN